MKLLLVILGLMMGVNNKQLLIKSNTFIEGKAIPMVYSCNGKNIHPPLEIENVPFRTKSFVLIVDDPDAPTGTFTHWIIWNITPQTTLISENSIPPGSINGMNDANKIGYTGPCPPSGTHRYFFRLYALDTLLTLPQGSSRNQLDSALSGHVIKSTELMGTFAK